jgi:hypothetical protein
MFLNFNPSKINSENLEKVKKPLEETFTDSKKKKSQDLFNANIGFLGPLSLLIFMGGCLLWYFNTPRNLPVGPIPTDGPLIGPPLINKSKPLIHLTQQELNDLKEGEGNRGYIMDIPHDMFIKLNENERENLLELKEVYLEQYLDKKDQNTDTFKSKSPISLKELLSLDNSLIKLMGDVGIHAFIRQLINKSLTSVISIDILKKTLTCVNELCSQVFVEYDNNLVLNKKKEIVEVLFSLGTSALQHNHPIKSSLESFAKADVDTQTTIIRKINEVLKHNAQQTPKINIDIFSHFLIDHIRETTINKLKLLTEHKIHNLFLVPLDILNTMTSSELLLLDFGYINEIYKKPEVISTQPPHKVSITKHITNELSIKRHLYIKHKILKNTLQHLYEQIDKYKDKNLILDMFELFFNQVYVKNIEEYSGGFNVTIGFGVKGERNDYILPREKRNYIIVAICKANSGQQTMSNEEEFHLQLGNNFIDNNMHNLSIKEFGVDNSGGGRNNCLLLSYITSILEVWSRVSIQISNNNNINHLKAIELKKIMIGNFSQKLQHFNGFLEGTIKLLNTPAAEPFKTTLLKCLKEDNKSADLDLFFANNHLKTLLLHLNPNIKTSEVIINNEDQLFDLVYKIYLNLDKVFRCSEPVDNSSPLPSCLLRAFISLYNEKQKNNFSLHMPLVSVTNIGILEENNNSEGIDKTTYANRSYTALIKDISPTGGKCFVLRTTGHFRCISICIEEKEDKCQKEIDDLSYYMSYFCLKWAAKKQEASLSNFGVPYLPQSVNGQKFNYKRTNNSIKPPTTIDHEDYFFVYTSAQKYLIDIAVIQTIYKSTLWNSLNKYKQLIKPKLQNLMIEPLSLP